MPIESLETRTLFSESASAQLMLTSMTGPGASPVYHYDVTVTDTGDTNIGSFWFAWIPGENFLPSKPSSVASPTGWSSAITGTNNQTDGSGIKWIAASNSITPGNSLGGFTFATADSPTALAGNSPIFTSSSVMLSEIYSGAPFSDAGYQFTVAPAVVTPVASTTTVVSSKPTSVTGSSVTFTATVAAASGGGAYPTGTVDFLQNGVSIGSAPISNGIAMLSTSSLPLGSQSITAHYGGDSFYSSSTSPAITQTVNSLPATTTTLVSSKSPAASGDSVTFTATVAPVASTGTAPTGTVTFSMNGTSLGMGTVQANGTAQLALSTLPIGSDPITAVYSGDANFAASTSTVITETVTTGTSPTTTALATSAAAIHSGDSVSFTATVAAVTPGGAVPAGTVSFTQDGYSLGTKPVQSDGTAVLSTTSLPLGTDNITATYSGDTHYAPSTSTTLVETVTTPPTLVPTITKSTLPITLVAGVAAHGSVTLAITNTTGAPVKGKITVELFASNTGSIDGSAIQLMRVVRAVNVKTTKPSMIGLGVKLTPTTMPAGAYTIFARVVDLAGNNNDSVAGPTMSVAAPVIALSETVTKSTIDTSAVSGTKAHVSVTLQITNSGNITTPNKTTVALYARLSGVVDTNAVQLISVNKPLRIRPNKSIKLGMSIKKVPVIAAGTYTLIAQVADPNGQVSSVVAGMISIS